MESFNALFRLARHAHIYSSAIIIDQPSVSLYADDLVAFIVPTEQDIRLWAKSCNFVLVHQGCRQT
jgi:hypothetical protein